MRVTGIEVLPNPRFPASGEPAVLVHARNVARLAGISGGGEEAVQREAASQKLRTYSAWGWDGLLTPADAERVVMALLRAQADYDDRQSARLEFEHFRQEEYLRKRQEAIEEHQRKMAAAKTELERHRLEQLKPSPPPPPSDTEKAFQEFLRKREKEAVK